MDVLQLADRFNLDDDFLVDDQVETVPIDGDATITDVDADLSGERNPARQELDAEGFLVGFLEKAGAEVAVNGDGGSDYLLGDVTVRGVGKPVWTAEMLWS